MTATKQPTILALASDLDNLREDLDDQLRTIATLVVSMEEIATHHASACERCKRLVAVLQTYRQAWNEGGIPLLDPTAFVAGDKAN